MHQSFRPGHLGVIAFLALVAGACGGGPEQEPRAKDDDPKPAAVSWVSDDSLDVDGVLVVDFGEIELGTIRVRTAWLESRSEHPSTIDLESLEAPLPGLSMPFHVEVGTKVLGPGERVPIIFSFSPTDAGEFEAEGLIVAGGLDFPFHLEGSAEEAKPCSFSVEPKKITFTVGAEEPGVPARGIVRVRAGNSGGCEISNVRLEGEPEFSIPIDGSEIQIAGGSTWALPVYFQPRAGASAILLFEVDGEEVQIPLDTSPTPSCAKKIEGEESPLMKVGCGATPWGKVANDCDELLDSIATVSPAGFLSASPPAPLAPGEEADIFVSFDLYSEESVERTIVVSFDNGDRLYFPVEAKFSFEESVLEFPLDPFFSLYVIDNSVAMLPFVNDLESIAHEIADNLQRDWHIGYQVAVTTTSLESDDGCGGEAGRLVPVDGERPKIINIDTPDFEAVLTANFDVGACAPKGLGAGLEAATLALDHLPPVEADDDANISLTFITAETDHSPHSLEHYEAEFRSKGVKSVHLVTPTEECGDFEEEERYTPLVRKLRGLTSPLCQPSPTTSFWYTSFSLNLDPSPLDWNGDEIVDEDDGFEVLLDGKPLPSGPHARWWISGNTLGIKSTGLNRHSHIMARYPATCILSRADAPRAMKP